jgi:type IV pilus assembly protein PilA
MELLIVVAILLIIGAVAVPRLNTARMQTQEMAAVRQIHTLHTAQTQYYSQFGRYAKTLLELGPPASGQPGPNGADLIPKDLAEGEKTGVLLGPDTGDPRKLGRGTGDSAESGDQVGNCRPYK